MGRKPRQPPQDPLEIVPENDGPVLGELIRQTVREQIRKNDPPEAAVTYRRLVSEGYAEADAVELMTAVLAAEIYFMMSEGRPFDPVHYIADLRRLPELPHDSDA